MSEHTISLHAGSLADTHAVAAVVAELARAGDIIVLSGEMGAGKTAFAQGFGRALGVSDRITSPTFTLVHSYPVEQGLRAGKITLHHADLYRLERTAEVADLALRELAEFAGIVLVEWGEVVDLFGDHLVIHLAPIEESDDDMDDTDDDVLALDGARLIDVGVVGPGWAARWQRLVDGLEAFRC
jgi:tRNA threonylcarbamoyladenosine biosynthesis protein TsaE